jgi:NOL1/NOP2/sun family putative RNA methylase
MKKYIEKMKYMPKDKFIGRIELLLNDKKDVEEFFKKCITAPKKAIRVNTLKITPDKLRKRLESYGWKIKQPFKDYSEVMIVESKLNPGEIGKTKEHILGYYYVQEITSMMPIFALKPKKGEVLLDLCAAPGSKTTQSAAMMENEGSIIANDLSVGRISILSSNLERCGVTNTIVTREAGSDLCMKLDKQGFGFDKILVDAPCSGEGNIRCSPRTCLEWSEKLLKSLSRKQKRLLEEAWKILKVDGELIYSTCTYSPEENESVVQHLLDKFDAKIVDINLPIKTRPGISEWKDKFFSKELKKAKRIYHHDNDMEGFFVCKLRKSKN